jgi:hypothetical protein
LGQRDKMHGHGAKAYTHYNILLATSGREGHCKVRHMEGSIVRENRREDTAVNSNSSGTKVQKRKKE